MKEVSMLRRGPWCWVLALILGGLCAAQDPVLQVATVVTRLEIRGAPPTVQTARSDIGEVIERQRLVLLPLKNRDFADLAGVTV